MVNLVKFALEPDSSIYAGVFDSEQYSHPYANMDGINLSEITDLVDLGLNLPPDTTTDTSTRYYIGGSTDDNPRIWISRRRMATSIVGSYDYIYLGYGGTYTLVRIDYETLNPLNFVSARLYVGYNRNDPSSSKVYYGYFDTDGNFSYRQIATLSALPLYEFEEAYPYDPSYRVPSAPASDIPLKFILNQSNIDFRHTIAVYDETNYSPLNMFLTNKVGTMEYTLVDFTYPNGKIVVETNMQFTHFICSSFTDGNTPRVYRVTSYKTLGNDLLEYSFTIDYLKDYFQHYGITTNNDPLVIRSTDVNAWSNNIVDSAYYNGKVKQDIFTIGTINDNYVIMTLTTNRIYLLTGNQFILFNNWLVEQEDQQVILSLISGVYQIPYGSFNNITTTSVSNIYFTDSIHYSVDSIQLIWGSSSSPFGKYISKTFSTSSIQLYNNWYEKTGDFKMYIPYYGEITLPAEVVENINDSTTFQIRYIINPYDGMVAVTLGGLTDQPTPFIPLPKRFLVSTSAIENIRFLNQTNDISMIGNTIGGIQTTFSGKNPDVISGMASAVTNTFMGDLMTNATEQHIRNSTGYNSIGGTGWNSCIFTNDVFFIHRELPELNIELEDIYEKNGYPCYKYWRNVGAISGERYWLEFQQPLKGTKEYVDNFLSSIKDGVVYNY